MGAIHETRPLQLARHRMDPPEPLDGVGLVDGQVDDDQRHEIAERVTVLFLAASDTGTIALMTRCSMSVSP